MKIYVATSCSVADFDDLRETINDDCDPEYIAAMPRVVARSHADVLTFAMTNLRDELFQSIDPDDDDCPFADDDPMYALTLVIDDVDPELYYSHTVHLRDEYYATIHVTVHSV